MLDKIAYILICIILISYTCLADDYLEENFDLYPESQIQDPYEKFNRVMFSTNKILDKTLLIPIASIYTAVTPYPIKHGVRNFLSNLLEPQTILYRSITFDKKRALTSFFRFIINTTFGIFGTFDVAKHMGLKSNTMTFSQVLSKYGAKNGPYLVLPLIGPSNIKNGFGYIIDFYNNPIRLSTSKNKDKFEIGEYSLRIISKRSSLLSQSKMLQDVAIDEYAATRDLYYHYNMFYSCVSYKRHRKR